MPLDRQVASKKISLILRGIGGFSSHRSLFSLSQGETFRDFQID
jgi:hypothetical protein